jgi:hypothetical protein
MPHMVSLFLNLKKKVKFKRALNDVCVCVCGGVCVCGVFTHHVFKKIVFDSQKWFYFMKEDLP